MPSLSHLKSLPGSFRFLPIFHLPTSTGWLQSTTDLQSKYLLVHASILRHIHVYAVIMGPGVLNLQSLGEVQLPVFGGT